VFLTVEGPIGQHVPYEILFPLSLNSTGGILFNFEKHEMLSISPPHNNKLKMILNK